jgi:transposase
MNPYEIQVGIDVSKATLELSSFDRGKTTVPNTAAGLRSLIARLQKLSESVRVCCEATGGYERLLVDTCHAADIPISVVNARQVRDFAKSKGILAKTDAIDARVIADYALQNNPRLTQKCEPWRKSLKALHIRREEVKNFMVQERNRLAMINDPLIAKCIRQHLSHLEKQLKTLDKQIQHIAETEPACRDQCEKLMQVKGFGLIVATGFLAFLPEIGRVTDNQLVALAGLAPFCQDSGTWKGQRHVSGGRERIRNTLYMPAITTSMHNPILKEFYQGLIQRGKPSKIALTAVMRKMVCLANRIIADPSFVPA